MNDSSSEIVEMSKAVQETAKATDNAIGSIRDTGSFLNNVFGELLQNAVGVVADKIKFYRIQRYHELARKTEENLKNKGIKITQPVPPSVALPIIENATVEENDDLHTLWSNLLANAMNPDFSLDVTRCYSSILSDLTPLDALILNLLYNDYNIEPEKYEGNTFFLREKLEEALKDRSKKQIELSLRNLLRLGCIMPGIVVVPENGTKIAGHAPTFYKDIEAFKPTILGFNLWQFLQP